MTAPIRLVLFDLDGTIVDSLAHISRAVADTARIIGVPPPAATQVPRVIGLSLEKALAQLFPEADPTLLVELERVYRETFARWRALPNQLEPLFEGTHGMLSDFADRGFTLGIATGKSRRGVDALLHGHNLTGKFVTIQTADHSPSKPNPHMVLQAMADTGAAPDSTVMVGDTTYDIEMALAARAIALGVGWGNHPAEDLRAAGAHAFVERMPQLLQAVETLIPMTLPTEGLSP